MDSPTSAHQVLGFEPIRQNETGLVKPAVSENQWHEKGNPRRLFFWGILDLFLEKTFSQQPNTLYLWLGILNSVKDPNSTQRNARKRVSRNLKTQGSHQNRTCKKSHFLELTSKNFLLQTERCSWEEGNVICKMYEQSDYTLGNIRSLPRLLRAKKVLGRSWTQESWKRKGLGGSELWENMKNLRILEA